jgi:hypothetical protein
MERGFAAPDFATAQQGRLASLADFRKLLLRALRVPDVARRFLVSPALFPRLAQAARGRFARLDPPLREIGFHALCLITPLPVATRRVVPRRVQ